jgi:hypothetical protein
LFDVDRSQLQRWVTTNLPILETALVRKAVLPKHKITSVEGFLRLFPQVKDVLVDGTERLVHRPIGKDVQKPYYSGKRKGHRAKNIVVIPSRKRVLMLSKTFPGSPHDKTGTNEEDLFISQQL